MSASFDRLATVTASTKRNPAASSGKVGAPVDYLTDLKILPLMPVTKEIVERYQLKSPRLSYVTYVKGSPDVLHGDVLAIEGDDADYRIVEASPWSGSVDHLELVIEKVAGN